MKENKYKVLINMCGEEGGDGCPAIVVNGDKVQIIGTQMTSDQVDQMNANSSTNVNQANNEVAVEIDIAIFEKAVQTYMATSNV